MLSGIDFSYVAAGTAGPGAHSAAAAAAVAVSTGIVTAALEADASATCPASACCQLLQVVQGEVQLLMLCMGGAFIASIQCFVRQTPRRGSC